MAKEGSKRARQGTEVEGKQYVVNQTKEKKKRMKKTSTLARIEHTRRLWFG